MSDPVSAGASHAGGALKHVPKWAWVASVGVVGGVVVMKMRSNKNAQVDKAPADSTAVGDYGLTAAPMGAGVVSAGQGAGDSGGGGGGSSSPAFDIPGFLDSLGGFVQAVRPDPVDTVGIINAVLPYGAGAGGAPNSSATQAPPLTVVYAPTPPPPPAAIAAAPQSYTRTVDNGKSGAAKRVWCMCGDHKVSDGKCWAEGHVCT